MNKLLIVIIPIAFLFACSGNKPQQVKTDSLKSITTKVSVQAKAVNKYALPFAYQSAKEKANDCKGKPDDGCSYTTLKYPVFKNQPVLNDTIGRYLIGSKITPETLHAYSANFFKDYYDSKSEDPANARPYQSDSDIAVELQDSSLVVLACTDQPYFGGAHGSHSKTFINWNTSQNNVIYLKDLLLGGYEPQLTKIAEKIFRKNEKISDTTSLSGNYFFKDGLFTLNNNFHIQQNGICFVYNEYEIKPYSEGTTDLLIPYSSIKKLLRQNTVISQYIK